MFNVCSQYQLKFSKISLHLTVSSAAILGSRKHHLLHLLVTKQWVTLKFICQCYQYTGSDMTRDGKCDSLDVV